MAQILSEAGYRTILVGMQHLVERHAAQELGYERVLPVAPAYDTADATIGLLRELARGDGPFYLEVGFEEPHRPYDFGGAQPDDSRGVAVPAYVPDSPESRRDFAEFQGSIRQMDMAVGRILAAVDELGLDRTTFVVFATDHGAAMPRAKCTLYDPGIEVALLWLSPTGINRPGQVISHLTGNVDVTPSLLDALGLPAPETLHGQSFWPRIASVSSHGAAPPRDAVFAEKTFHTYYEPMRAIRTSDYKLIVNFEISTLVDIPADIRHSPIYPLIAAQWSDVRPPIELYDLSTDPWEQHNLATEPDLAPIRTQLRDRLRTWMETTDDPLLRGPIASPYYHDSMTWLRATPNASA
ncbi:MAG: hypothetical protein NVSMB2_16750 [Chloroflexota bacterium]